MNSIYKLIIALIFISSAAFSQQVKQQPKLPVDETSKLFSYTSVVPLPGTKISELFNRALEWCNSYYKNPSDVIREKDSVEGNIVCKARFKISNPPDKKGFSSDAGVIQYTFKLMFKDGKYKYDMTEFNWKQTSYFAAEKWTDTSSSYYLPEFDFYLQQLNEKAKEISKDFEKAMIASAKQKKSDW